MNGSPKYRATAVLGLVAGVVALVLITAILAAAVSSSHANRDMSTALTRLEQVTAQLADLQEQADSRQVATVRARHKLMAQNAELQAQVDALNQYLRAHGLKAPVASRRVAPAPPAPAPTPARPAKKHHGKARGHHKH